MVKPTYIGIGAGRCGTTSLHAALMRHPNVNELKRKEVHYWDRKYRNRPIEWYFKLFKPGCAGEITPSYFFVPGVPERIAKHCPNVKLLVLLRNPVDAMWSSYQRLIRRRQTKVKSVLDFLDQSRNLLPLVERRHYASHLARWFAVFDKEQFWIMQSEKLFQGGSLASLWKFLEVPVKQTGFPWEQGPTQEKMEPQVRGGLTQVFQQLNEELYELLGERYDW